MMIDVFIVDFHDWSTHDEKLSCLSSDVLNPRKKKRGMTKHLATSLCAKPYTRGRISFGYFQAIGIMNLSIKGSRATR